MSAGLILPLLVIFAGLMFLAQRRQKKEARAVQSMQDALAPGDLVMTTSGLHGTIVDLDDDTVDLEIAEDVVTTWNRLAIRQRVVPTVDPLVTDDSELAGAEDERAPDSLAALDDTRDTGPRLTKD